MDCFTVITSWVPLILASFIGSNLSVFKVVRAVRVLRPLKFISRFEGLKTTLLCFFGAIVDIINMFFVMLLFLLLFSIFAVSMLKGKFHYCESD